MGPLLAYDTKGDVVATLDYMVARNQNGDVVGLIDFDVHEAAGGKLRGIWEISGAVGSGTWPEWLGGAAHDFRVELDKNKQIVALIHRKSGYRRERATVLAAIEAVELDESGAKDIRHLVGGPTRYLVLDSEGRTTSRPSLGTPVHLPVVTGTPPDR